jgi:competence protein ComGC
MSDALRRNSQTVALVAVVIILIVVAVVFLMQWQSATSERDTVETQMNVAEVSLTQARVQYDLVELRKQEAELKRSPEFPTTLPIVGLSLFLADGALQNQVTLTEVDPPEKVGSEKIGSKAYPAYATAVTASGSLTKLRAFLEYIEGGGFTSIRVQNLAMVQTPGAWEADFTVVVISQT